ncbi:exported protein of unknown function [Pararobbsia alpina]
MPRCNVLKRWAGSLCVLARVAAFLACACVTRVSPTWPKRASARPEDARGARVAAGHIDCSSADSFTERIQMHLRLLDKSSSV